MPFTVQRVPKPTVTGMGPVRIESPGGATLPGVAAQPGPLPVITPTSPGLNAPAENAGPGPVQVPSAAAAPLPTVGYGERPNAEGYRPPAPGFAGAASAAQPTPRINGPAPVQPMPSRAIGQPAQPQPIAPMIAQPAIPTAQAQAAMAPTEPGQPPPPTAPRARQATPFPGGEPSEPGYPLPPAADQGADPFQEFEDDTGEVTQIDAQHALAEQTTHILEEEQPPPFLECSHGKDLGKEFVLHVGETTLGRSIDNDIILTDIAVSRRHLKVDRGEDGVLKLHDMGSGNGTLVNGKRAYDVVLVPGDRIELGETVLVVRIPPPREQKLRKDPTVPVGTQGGQAGQLPPPVDPSHPANVSPPVGVVEAPRGGVVVSRGVLLAAGVIGSLIVVALAAILTALVIQMTAHPTPVAVPTQPLDVAPVLAEAQRAYQERRWEDARSAYERVVTIDGTNAEAAERLAWLPRARDEEALYAAARTALEQNRASEALQKARQIEARSPFFADATTIANRARDMIVRDLVAQGNTALEEQRLDDARALLTSARDLDASNPGVVELARELAEAEAIADGDAGLEETDAGTEEVVDATAPIVAVAPDAAPAAAPDAAVVAQAPDAARATNPPDAAVAARPDAATPRATPDAAVARAQDAGRRQQTETLAQRRERERRERRERENNSRNGNRQQQITTLLIQAQAEIRNGNERSGCVKVVQALALDRTNDTARQQIPRCERAAQTLVERAASLESRNRTEAIAIYRTVTQMLPGGQIRARAQTRITALNNRDEDQ